MILCINITTAYDEDDLEWACGNSKELHLGETISNGNFTVEAYNFPRSDQNGVRFVGIRLYENGIHVSDQTLVEGEEYLHDDEIRITALEFSIPASDWTTDLPEEPWARIKLEPRGLPCFDVEFETDEDEYEPCSHIEVNLTIQNIGDAKADDVNVHIDAEALEVTQGKINHHYSEIERGRLLDGKTDTAEFDPIMLRFGVPSVIEDCIFNLTVNIEYSDIKNLKYSYSKSCPLKVSGMFTISKSINDDIYIDEIAAVTISLANDGKRPISSIRVRDTLPPEFELTENSSLSWELDLDSGERRSFTYFLRPLQPNEEGCTISAAIAEWTEGGNDYSARSDSPCIAVYGPKIELSKTASPETTDVGGIVTVTVEVANTGNVLASIGVTDSLPENAVLLGGVLGADAVLRAGESHTFSYTMRMDAPGSVELPPAIAHFVDVYDYDGTTVSESVSLTTDTAAIPRAAQTIDTSDRPIAAATAASSATRTDERSGLGSVCVLVGFLAAVFLIMRVRRRRT